MTQVHLTEQQLKEFLNGKDEGYAQVLEHIETCEICEKKLRAMVRLDAAHSDFPARPKLEVDSAENVFNPETLRLEQSQRFEIRHEIAEGGMGVIYQAEDQLMRRTVALKVIKPEYENNADATARFIQEARICGMLQHPGIVPVHDLGLLEDSKPFLTMKLIDGQTLADLIRKQTPVVRLMEVFAQVCQTMAFVHSQNVIHRDIKPANIMVGEFGEVQIMDWGIAKLLDAPSSQSLDDQFSSIESVTASALSNLGDSESGDRKTQSGMVIGTPGYMPPEQALGQINKLDKRADVFALGAILCEILTGKPVGGDLSSSELLKFTQNPDYKELDQKLKDSGQDPMLIGLVRNCLSIDIKDRPSDANDVSEIISNWKTNTQLRLKQIEIDFARSETGAANEKKRRQLTIAVAGLLLAFAGTAIGSLLYLSNQNAKVAAANKKKLEQTIENDRQINRYLSEATEKQADAIESQTLKPEVWEDVLHSVELAGSLVDENTDDQLKVLIANMKVQLNKQISTAKNNANRQRRYEQTLQQLAQARLKLIDYEQDGVGDTEHRNAVGLYESAFATFGIEPESSIKNAIKLFKSAPSHVQEPLVAAIQEWHTAYRNYNKPKGRYASWLRTIYERMDYKPRRSQLRTAYLNDEIETVIRMMDEIVVADDIEYLIASRALNRHKKFAERRELLKKSVAAFPNNFWLNYYLASDYQARNPLMIESALNHYFICGAIEPDSYLPMNNVGGIYIQQNKFDLALAHFKRLTEISPNRAIYRVNLGAVLMNYRRLPEALTQLNKAVALDPNIPQAHVNLGEVYSLMKEFDKAKTAFERALEINPNLSDTYVSIARVSMFNQDYEAAEKALDKLLSSHPNHATGIASRAELLMHQGKFLPAEATMKQAIDLSPQNIGQYINLSLIQKKLDKNEDALATLLTAEKLDPSDHRVQNDLATIYSLLGKPEEAESARQKADELEKLHNINSK